MGKGPPRAATESASVEPCLGKSSSKAPSQEEAGESRQRASRWSAWVAPTVILTLLSLTSYGVVRNAYEKFYAQFGVVPEDLGYDSTRILSETGFGLFTQSVPILLIPLGLYVASIVVPSERVLLWILTGVFLLMSVFLLWAVFLNNLPIFAKEAADCARNGNSVRFVRSASSVAPGLGRVVLLAVRAQPTTVEWVDHAPAGVKLSDKVMYLGESGGTTIVYDVVNKNVVRIPSGAAAFVTDNRRLLSRDVDVCKDYDAGRPLPK